MQGNTTVWAQRGVIVGYLAIINKAGFGHLGQDWLTEIQGEQVSLTHVLRVSAMVLHSIVRPVLFCKCREPSVFSSLACRCLREISPVPGVVRLAGNHHNCRAHSFRTLGSHLFHLTECARAGSWNNEDLLTLHIPHRTWLPPTGSAAHTSANALRLDHPPHPSPQSPCRT